MNDIDVRRFVNINIKQHVETAISGTRDVVILYTHEGTQGKISGVNTETIGDAQIFTSFKDATAIYNADDFPDTYKYLSMYYDNGGAKIVVIEGIGYEAFTAEIVAQLDNKYILICLCDAAANALNTYAKLKAVATSRMSNATIYGVNEKILFGRATTMNDTDVISNFASKYSNVYAAEMTMAAYLSKINVYGVNTVNDYTYTAEVIDEEVLTDSQYETLMLNNMNVDTYLAGNVRNLCGNLKNGADMTNSFVRIVLHQTLTERLLETLVTKVKNSEGIGKLYSTMCNEIASYKNCGYLSLDKIWEDETLSVTVNGKTYEIITKGTALINGYQVTVLPMTALTANDKALRKAPPIYVVIADQYGIRALTVNGEII